MARPGRTRGTVPVQMHAAVRSVGISLPCPAALNARADAPVEEWLYLDEGSLLNTRTRKVCMDSKWLKDE
jgi:hypothetical protein